MAKREINKEAGFHEEGLREPDVFITEFINTSSNFFGIIKQRYTDFQVREIDNDGKVAYLTRCNNVSPIFETQSADTAEALNEDVNIEEIPVEEITYPLDSVEQWKQLTLLMKRNNQSESIRIEVTSVDKSGRGALHNTIFKRYAGKLYSNTITVSGKKFIVVGTKKDADKRNHWTWPKNLPQYLYFVLYKENTDTMTAVRTISNHLRIPQNSITYAGTKDRRAVTTQWMCIRRGNPKKLSSLNLNKLRFGNYGFRDKPLSLGDLKGNRFIIALRQVDSAEKNIELTLQRFKETGFINYYGLQRFGSRSSAPTYEIGKHLLCNRWKEAVDLILTPCCNDKHPDVRGACEVWSRTHDASEAMKSLKHNATTEGIILKTLAKQGNTAFINALQKIPRNILLLYLHSFQSLIWNQIISRRIQKFGLSVLAGDLIFDINVDPCTHNDSVTCVKPVPATDIESISIYDVVYPLPGYSVKYPENIIATWYEKILADHGISNFNRKNKMFTTSGDYRKMMALAENVIWKTVFYNNLNADLIPTDLQRLNNENTVENFSKEFYYKSTNMWDAVKATGNYDAIKILVGTIGQGGEIILRQLNSLQIFKYCGSYEAVILELSLPSSSYATMALRELTKIDTSSSFQSSLTTHHSQNKKARFDS